MLELSSCKQCPPDSAPCSFCPSSDITKAPRPQLRLLVSFPPVIFRQGDAQKLLSPLHPGWRAGASPAPQPFCRSSSACKGLLEPRLSTPCCPYAVSLAWTPVSPQDL